jgi:hypothetical protein
MRASNPGGYAARVLLRGREDRAGDLCFVSNIDNYVDMLSSRKAEAASGERSK